MPRNFVVSKTSVVPAWPFRSHFSRFVEHHHRLATQAKSKQNDKMGHSAGLRAGTRVGVEMRQNDNF